MTSESEPLPGTTALVVQARMTSSRLPGKILAEVDCVPLLALLVRRLGRCTLATDLIVATTDNSSDDPVAALCEAEGVTCFRGSEDDVLGRFVGALSLTDAKTIVRLTGDSPLIDPEIVDGYIRQYQASTECDYMWCGTEPTLPNGYIAEVFSREMLTLAAATTNDPYDREHVTPWLRKPDSGYRICDWQPNPDLSHLRLSIDYPEDLELVTRILEALLPNGDDFTLPDIAALLTQNPSWLAINADVKQTTGPFRDG